MALSNAESATVEGGGLSLATVARRGFRFLVHAKRECLYRATLADAFRLTRGNGRETMCRIVTLVGNLALGIVALLCGASGQVGAASAPQQFDARNFQAATAKANEYCTTLWSDHAFDPFRDKMPFLGEQPTSSMLTNSQRVRPEDKPLADLVLKTAAKCNAAFATALAMLPPPVHAKVLSAKRKGDTLNKQLSEGKITFGEYNVKRVEILKQAALAQVDEAAALDQQVTQLYKHGHFSEALPLAQRAPTIREKALGPDHPDVATSLNNLAGFIKTKVATQTPSRCTSGRWRYERKRSVPIIPMLRYR